MHKIKMFDFWHKVKIEKHNARANGRMIYQRLLAVIFWLLNASTKGLFTFFFCCVDNHLLMQDQYSMPPFFLLKNV